MLKYSPFFPDTVATGVQGTTLAPTRNIYRGAWSASEEYFVNDIVTYAGSSYSATANNTNIIPTDTNYWAVLAQKGDYTDIKFKRSLSEPSVPTGNDPVGWDDSIPPGTETLWMTTATKDAIGTLKGTWSVPTALTAAVFRGAYSSTETYYLHNQVTYNGGTYIALQDNFTNKPPTGTSQANAYWDVIAAPGEEGTPSTPPSAFNAPSLLLTSGAAVNLRSVADANGYTGQSDATITFKVPNGVICRGLSGAPGGYGIDTGSWPTGYTITLALVIESGGIVNGGGGRGGTGGSGGNGGTGGTGGDAIYCRVPITISVNAGGIIRRGAGGGGGGAGYTTNVGGEPLTRAGGGGGGGFPNGTGGLGGSSDLGTGSTGNPGTVSTGGTGGAGAGTGSGTGGTGGGLTTGATAGSNSASASGGNAGADGYAIRKNGKTVTVNNSGTITGTVG